MLNQIPKKALVEILGWYGTIAILGAYALQSFEMVSAQSGLFQLLNLSGAVGLLVTTYYQHAAQSVVINVFRAGIAIIALVRIISFDINIGS